MSKRNSPTRRPGTRRAARKSPAPAPVAAAPTAPTAADTAPDDAAGIPGVISLPLDTLPPLAARAIGRTLTAVADARREALGRADRGAWELVHAAALCTAAAHRDTPPAVAVAMAIAREAARHGPDAEFVPGAHTPDEGQVVASV